MDSEARREEIRKRVEAARRDQNDREQKQALIDAAIRAAQGSGQRAVDVDEHTKHNLLLHGAAPAPPPDDHKEQRETCYPMPEAFTDPTKDHTAAGIALERVGNIRGMVRAFEAAYEFNPNPHVTGRNLGYTYMKVGLWQRAAPLLHAAHQHDPENEEIAHDFQTCMQYVHQQRAEQEVMEVQEELTRPPHANLSICDGAVVALDTNTLQCSVELDVRVREAEEVYTARRQEAEGGGRLHREPILLRLEVAQLTAEQVTKYQDHEKLARQRLEQPDQSCGEESKNSRKKGKSKSKGKGKGKGKAGGAGATDNEFGFQSLHELPPLVTTVAEDASSAWTVDSTVEGQRQWKLRQPARVNGLVAGVTHVLRVVGTCACTVLHVFQPYQARANSTPGKYSLATERTTNFTAASMQLSTPSARPLAPEPVKWSSTRSSLKLRWVASHDNGAAIESYEVQIRDVVDGCDRSEWRTEFVISGAEMKRECAVKGLAIASAYEVRLRATNSLGQSGWSPAVIATTSSAVPSAPPLPMLTDAERGPASDSTIAVGGARSLLLEWQAPDDNGARISSFELQMAPEGCLASREALAEREVAGAQDFLPVYEGSEPHCRIEHGLEPNSVYAFRVAATNACGRSLWSPVARFQTAALPPGRPAAPSADRGKSSQTSLCVRWAEPADTGGSNIVEFLLMFAPVLPLDVASSHSRGGKSRSKSKAKKSALQFKELYRGSAHSYVLRDLNPGCVYAVRVACRSAHSDAWSEFSSDAKLSTTAAAPGAPSCPVLISVGTDGVSSECSSLVVGWQNGDARGATISNHECEAALVGPLPIKIRGPTFLPQPGMNIDAVCPTDGQIHAGTVVEVGLDEKGEKCLQEIDPEPARASTALADWCLVSFAGRADEAPGVVHSSSIRQRLDIGQSCICCPHAATKTCATDVDLDHSEWVNGTVTRWTDTGYFVTTVPDPLVSQHIAPLHMDLCPVAVLPTASAQDHQQSTAEQDQVNGNIEFNVALHSIGTFFPIPASTFKDTPAKRNNSGKKGSGGRRDNHGNGLAPQEAPAPPPSATARVAGLLPGRSYAVRARCSNSAGLGRWSEPALMYTASALPPCPPPPQLRKRGRSVLRLYFLPPAELNGSRIIGWVLQARKKQEQQLQQGSGRKLKEAKYSVVYEGSDRDAVFSNLASGCAYELRVAAETSAGITGFSSPVVMRTEAAPPPAPPSPRSLAVALAAGDVGSAHKHIISLQLSLTAEGWQSFPARTDVDTLVTRAAPVALQVCFQPPSCDNGSPIERCVVEMREIPTIGRGANDNAAKPCVIFDGQCGAGGVLTLSGLRPGRQLRFRAQVANAVGSSSFSSLGDHIVTEALPPTKPTAPQCLVPPTATTLKVKWEPPSDTGGAPLSGYCIEREGADLALVPAQRNQHAFAKLPPDSEQRIRICASNRAGESEYSDWATFRTAPLPPKAIAKAKLKGSRPSASTTGSDTLPLAGQVDARGSCTTVSTSEGGSRSGNGSNDHLAGRQHHVTDTSPPPTCVLNLVSASSTTIELSWSLEVAQGGAANAFDLQMDNGCNGSYRTIYSGSNTTFTATELNASSKYRSVPMLNASRCPFTLLLISHLLFLICMLFVFRARVRVVAQSSSGPFCVPITVTTLSGESLAQRARRQEADAKMAEKRALIAKLRAQIAKDEREIVVIEKDLAEGEAGEPDIFALLHSLASALWSLARGRRRRRATDNGTLIILLSLLVPIVLAVWLHLTPPNDE